MLYYIILYYIILFYTSDNFRKPHETFRKLFENLRNPLETFKNKPFIETFRNLWKPIGALWKLFRKPSEHRQTLRNQTFGNLSKTFGEVFCSGSREAVRTVGSIGSVGSAVGSISVGSAVGSVVGSASQLSVLQAIFGWLWMSPRLLPLTKGIPTYAKSGGDFSSRLYIYIYICFSRKIKTTFMYVNVLASLYECV